GDASELSPSCALVASGGAPCWGDNCFSQRGRPGGSDSIGKLVTGFRIFTQLVAGARHTCGLDGAGAAWCWGDNANGQLGIGFQGGMYAVPTAVAGGHQFTTLSAGDHHTCGIAIGGLAYCWGGNGNGELGDSGKVVGNTGTPTAVYGGVAYRAIAAGVAHTCALAAADSTPRCWGADGVGQLGDSTLTVGGSDTAVVVRGNIHARNIAVGAAHSCANNATFTFCWGRNNHGQLGNTNLGVNSDKPVTVNGGSGPLSGALSLGGDHSCVMTSGSNLFCWGSNATGELGNGLAPADGDHALQGSTGGLSSFLVSAGAAPPRAPIARLSGPNLLRLG